MYNNETIVAISTAIGGAISVVRLSGSNAKAIINNTVSATISVPRHAYFCDFVHNGTIVDEVVVTWFEAPFSYTGEDVVEISCHGSRWITNEILRICTVHGARLASAGEFTQRAFLNGKMDLSQAEAVGDLIAASSRCSASVALSQMRGGYTTLLSEMRSKLLHISSMLELELDFGEEDVEFASRDELVRLLKELEVECKRLTDSFALGNVLKNGIPVAIVGKPNVGKSTLLNILVGEERAIVSDIAGTTRDYLEEVVNLNGVDFRFIDTAGIRHTDDVIETLGVERSLERMQKASVIIQLVDNEGFTPVDLLPSQRLLIVGNKSDKSVVSGCDLNISAKHGVGIEELRSRLVLESGVLGYSGDEVVVSNIRHYEALRGVLSAISDSLSAVDAGLSGDLIVSNLSLALEHLGSITGEFTTDEILGNIFRNFCIGK